MTSHWFGTSLSEVDLAMLKDCGIPREQAEDTNWRRVDTVDGGAIVGRNGSSGDYAGIVIPYYWPGESESIREYRLRLDHPELEDQGNGKVKERAKYLSPPGKPNRLYFNRRTSPEWLENASLPVIILEGEKKCEAVWHLAWHGLGESAERPRWLPVSIPGVYGFRSKTGIVDDAQGKRRTVKGMTPDFNRVVWKKRDVVVLFDGDVHHNEDVSIARNTLAKALRQRGARILFADLGEDLGLNGIDDVIGRLGEEAGLKIIAGAYDPKQPEWRKSLLKTEDGKIKSCISNFALCFSQHPDWQKGLCYDELRNVITVTEHAPREIPRGPLEDITVLNIRCWSETHFLDGSDEKIRGGIEVAARLNQFHPLRDYVKNCKWDGISRVPTFFQVYFGASDRDDLDSGQVDNDKAFYLSSVATMWGVSAIARIFKPGCQVDHLLVLEGPQGIYKSQALQALFGAQYFCDQMPHLDNKDSSLQLRGKWCVELGEFDRMARYDSSTLKAFLTRQVDVYRKPYGRQTVEVPRHTIFAATVNPPEYLIDEQNRRVWPVLCTEINVEKLRSDRDLIWAELYELFRKGTKWWPTEEQLRQMLVVEQEKRVIEDPYYGCVLEWVQQQSRKQGWATIDILRGLDIAIEQYKSVDQHIAKVMRKLGYEKKRPDPLEPRRWFLKTKKV
jgi:hypothetical protein